MPDTSTFKWSYILETNDTQLKIDTAWNTYNSISHWISAADTKAELSLGTIGVIGTIILTSLVDTPPSEILSNRFQLILLILGCCTSILSVYFCFRCLNPKLSVGEPTSSIYFSHIAKQFSSAKRYHSQVSESWDDQQILEELAHQIWANSHIAQRKYVSVAWALRFLSATVFLSILGILSTLV